MMTYDFIKNFEDNWQEIYNEYQQVNQLLTEWPEKQIYDKGWEVFVLFDFPNGNEIVKNTQLCPVTSKLIKDLKGHGVAGFSRLAANTHILPHRGYCWGNYLRAHLGLVVPEGDCALKVKNQIYRWQQGKVLTFDDGKMHEAWNNTEQDRIVLLFDLVP